MSQPAAVAVLAATRDVAMRDTAEWAPASRAVMRAAVARVATCRGLRPPCWADGPAPADARLLAGLGNVASWSAAELGQLYEAIVEGSPGEGSEEVRRPVRGGRQAAGAYFTPPGIADPLAGFAVGLMAPGREDVARGEPPPIVIDPACGAGVVMVQAARAIAERCLGRPGLLADVIEECVFGVDMDPVAVDLARAALWLELDGSAPITAFDRNIVCGDTLAGATPPHFEERCGGRGPLIVLGNPPYLDRAPRPAGWPKRHEPSSTTAPSMGDFLPEDGGRVGAEHLGNTYVYFWRWAAWRAMERRLDSPGLVGLITPSAWLESPGFSGMRRHLRRWADLGLVIDLSPEGHRPTAKTRVFPGVQIPLSLVFFAREDAPIPRPARTLSTEVHGDRQAKALELRAKLDALLARIGDPRPAAQHEAQEVRPMEPRIISVERIRILEGHNARKQVGDVSELAASIRANGVLQALTVVELPPDGTGPVYGLVVGERRLTAARQVGVEAVPCLVCDLDERQRTVAMLVENLQRQDLEPMEEASGIERLAGMGLNQRQIAAQLSCSQSHVSKRLALLALPEKVQAAIGAPSDSGGITVADALELTRLADHPSRIEHAFDEGRHGHYGGVAGAVRSDLRDLERERKVAEARSRLTSAGVKILKEAPYYSWSSSKAPQPLLGCGADYAALQLTIEQHQGEPCHVAAIDRDGAIVYACADPGRHALADPKVAKAQTEERERREKERLGREASRRRREVIADVLATANSSHLPFAARQVIAGWRVDECKLACQLLEIPPPEKQGNSYPRYPEALGEYASQGMGAAIRAVLALALAAGEQIVTGTWGGVGDRSRRHIELLVTAGYQPNDVDRKHLATEGELDVPGCRVCGCSEDDPCEGGCQWVEDPDDLGDLCSRCLADMQETSEEEALAGGESR